MIEWDIYKRGFCDKYRYRLIGWMPKRESLEPYIKPFCAYGDVDRFIVVHHEDLGFTMYTTGEFLGAEKELLANRKRFLDEKR